MKAQLFCGWLRTPGTDWRPIVQAPTWGEAWRLLIPAPYEGLTCEKVVTKDGRHPDHRRKPR